LAKLAVLLATIGAAHGIKGEVRVKAHSADPMALASYGVLSAQNGRGFDIERLRLGKGVVVAKFRGVDDRNAAEALNGIDLYVARERLPAAGADEFYHADLIGLAAVNTAGEELGAVIAIYNFGAGDILEIAPPRGETMMLPFTKEIVPAVDIAAGRITVVPPAETEARPEGE
jgi:16S rRNA processing protein RimM